jgi:signal transduction histidine kinase
MMANASSAFAPSALRRRYTALLMSLMVGVVGLLGAVGLLATFRESRDAMARLQAAEALEIAEALRLTLGNVARNVEAVEGLPWHLERWLTPEVRREEYGRLLRLVPAAEEVARVSPDGHQVLRVSRLSLDLVEGTREVAGTSGQASLPRHAPTTSTRFRHGNDPLLELAVHADGSSMTPGATVVTIGLRALAQELKSTLERPDTEIYVLDSDGIVVLHRNPSLMLAHLRVEMPEHASAESTPPSRRLLDAASMHSVVPVAGLPLRVVVEQPRSTLMAPVWKAVLRTALVLVAAMAAASFVGAALASRITRPIRQLHTGAQQLAAGDLATRISVRTGDELEDLAAQFNRMAESLQASVAELEARVAERTAALALANQHKSEFLAHMSHELRTPLNAILGFADVLREGMAGPLTDEQREYLGDIHASGLHLLALINDVLDIARIEAGRLELELAPLAVAELVGATVASMRAAALKKKLVLTVDIGTAPSSLVGDARRLKQVLLNLIGNAVKFTPEGGRIAVRARPSTRFAGGLRVEVQDSGVGIAPAELEQVWSAFVRVGGRDTAQVEGAGLGLPLVKKLVELHGGSVGVASAPGAGSDFHIELPATPPAATPGEAP